MNQPATRVAPRLPGHADIGLCTVGTRAEIDVVGVDEPGLPTLTTAAGGSRRPAPLHRRPRPGRARPPADGVLPVAGVSDERRDHVAAWWSEVLGGRRPTPTSTAATGDARRTTATCPSRRQRHRFASTHEPAARTHARPPAAPEFRATPGTSTGAPEHALRSSGLAGVAAGLVRAGTADVGYQGTVAAARRTAIPATTLGGRRPVPAWPGDRPSAVLARSPSPRSGPRRRPGPSAASGRSPVRPDGELRVRRGLGAARRSGPGGPHRPRRSRSRPHR